MMAAIGFREVPMRAISSVLLILSLGFGGSALAADEAQPVSYTHLTLPTILLV